MLTEVTKKVLFIRCMFVFTVSLHSCGSNRVKRGFCSTRNLDIKNGNYRLRSGNSVAEFTCDDGFQLYGVERIVCITTKWSNDPPMCISNTCAKIPPTSTLKVVEEFEGAVLKFSCAVMHQLDGQKQLICDGTDWNGLVPSCKPWNPPQTCDFEDPEICGWSHHDENDQDWRWNTGNTSTSRTGPSHDHTLGDEGNDISDLEVFIKPENTEDLNKLQRIFHVNETKGDVWNEECVKIPVQSEPFQVLFVATRATKFRSDIAIDDAALGECAGTLPPDHMTTAPTNVTDLTEPVTTVVQPTKERTTVQTSTKEEISTVKQTSTGETTVKTTRQEARDGPSVVWIVLGVALVLVVAVAILFVIYLYRRRQNRRRRQVPLSSSNPLYEG